MEIKIRRAAENDIEAIADIKIEGWRNAYKGIIDDKFLESMNKTEEIKKQRKNISKECLIVAEYNNKITGFSLYRDYNKNIELYPNADCEISSIYIKPSLKRNGIGKKIMEYIIADLKNKGKKQMILGCLTENYPSRAFYDKMGAAIFEYTKAKFGNKEYDLVMYKYDLNLTYEKEV